MPPRNLTHIPPLPRDARLLAYQKIDRLAISPEAKLELKRMLSAASNPNNDQIETIIKTLPKARQEEIYRIFDEVAAMQKAQVEQGNNALLALGLLTLGGLIVSYLLTTDQAALQKAQLLAQMKRAYVNGIQDEIDYCGCNARARLPSGEELAYLETLAERDANSIVSTYNKQAQNQLERLYKDNPTADKQFFVVNMRAWAEKRAGWKGLQIAFSTEAEAREYARLRFMQTNYADTARFKFTGPPAVCKRCLRQFAAGFVDLAHVLAHPTPIHPFCPHSWRITRKPKVDCARLWTG